MKKFYLIHFSLNKRTRNFMQGNDKIGNLKKEYKKFKINKSKSTNL